MGKPELSTDDDDPRNAEAYREFALWVESLEDGYASYELWPPWHNTVTLDGNYRARDLRALADLIDKYHPVVET